MYSFILNLFRYNMTPLDEAKMNGDDKMIHMLKGQTYQLTKLVFTFKINTF